MPPKFFARVFLKHEIQVGFCATVPQWDIVKVNEPSLPWWDISDVEIKRGFWLTIARKAISLFSERTMVIWLPLVLGAFLAKMNGLQIMRVIYALGMQFDISHLSAFGQSLDSLPRLTFNSNHLLLKVDTLPIKGEHLAETHDGELAVGSTLAASTNVNHLGFIASTVRARAKVRRAQAQSCTVSESEDDGHF